MEDLQGPSQGEPLVQRKEAGQYIQKQSSLPSKNDNFWKKYEQNLGTVKEEELKESNRFSSSPERHLAESALQSSLIENPHEGVEMAHEEDEHSGEDEVDQRPVENLHQKEQNLAKDEVNAEKLQQENRRAKANEMQAERDGPSVAY